MNTKTDEKVPRREQPRSSMLNKTFAVVGKIELIKKLFG
jgi:hypothetical protein